MRNLVFAIIVLLSADAYAQHPTYRNYGFHYRLILNFGAGPETGVAFPPKVSFHAYLPRQKVVYGGLDLGLCTVGFSKTAGVTVGAKVNIFLLENAFSWTSVYQSHAPNKMWLSCNPKLGVEIDKFTLKIGPSFILKEYNGHHKIQDLLMIGSQHFNIEIGYIIESN